MKQYDWLLIGGLLLSGVIMGLALWLFFPEGERIVIYVGSEKIAEYPLAQDAEYVITGIAGGVNRLHIQDGKAWLIDADCPDKLCVKMGAIDKEGQSIICLPHQVVIEIPEH